MCCAGYLFQSAVSKQRNARGASGFAMSLITPPRVMKISICCLLCSITLEGWTSEIVYLVYKVSI